MYLNINIIYKVIFMNNFKLSNKKIYKDNRSSIENLHDEKLNSIIEKNNCLDEKKKQLTFLKQKLIFINNNNNNNNNNNKSNSNNNNNNNEFISPVDIKNEIYNLKKEINDIENNIELLDYIHNAKEFLYNFDNDYEEINKEFTNKNQIITDNQNENKNDNQNNNQNDNENDNENIIENKTKNENKNENCDNSKKNILNFINKTGKKNKGEEYNRYYNKCFMNIISDTSSSNNYCINCKSSNFEIDNKNGIIICTECGFCKQYLENTLNSINFSDCAHIEIDSQPFSYQRKNHFKEWLIQLQGKEVTIIPDSVINLVLLEIKKERINDINEINSERIKKYLKKLKLNKYYEHIPNLISKITNKPPLIITHDFEKILLDLFDKIQEPFIKHCPKTRKNFLSYSYTLHKFCQLLDKNEFLIYFPLLKSREKLFEQEKIWKEICFELNWKFIPCV
jgi:hypothetical protein